MSDGHYFNESPDVDDRRRRVTFALDGREWTLTASSGVFSADRLDPGTAVLLQQVPAVASAARDGVLLDLGCGYGAIACVLAVRAPAAHVWAVDVNARARELTALNAASLGADANVTVAAPDDVPADVLFDELWSNPPIRIGKAALHGLLLRWLPRLTPQGQAWLVVSKNLGSDSLHRWLEGEGWQVDRAASAKGFRVLRVTRPSVGR